MTWVVAFLCILWNFCFSIRYLFIYLYIIAGLFQYLHLAFLLQKNQHCTLLHLLKMFKVQFGTLDLTRKIAAFYSISRVIIKIPHHCFALFGNKPHVWVQHNTMCCAICLFTQKPDFFSHYLYFSWLRKQVRCSGRLSSWKQFSGCFLWGCVTRLKGPIAPSCGQLPPGCFLLFRARSI